MNDPHTIQDRIKSTFFSFGLLQDPVSPSLLDKLRGFENELSTIPIDGYGRFFYSEPSYIDLAKTDTMVWIKLGFVHDQSQLLSMQDIIDLGWVSMEGIDSDKLEGSTTLIGLKKHQPSCFIYCNLVAPPLIYYWNDGSNLIAADNLHLMKELLSSPQFNNDVIASHYIYRFVYGEESYLQGVKKLLPGEMLTKDGEKLRVELIRDLRPFTNPDDQISVSQDTIDWFFDKLSNVVSLHLKDNLNSSGTNLSGGIDSSLLQAAISEYPSLDFPFPTFSFVIDSPDFNYEIDYTKEAVEAFNTDHHFVEFSEQQFADLLIESIDVLGRPISFDGTAYFWGLLGYLSSEKRSIKYLFDGTLADGLLGSSRSNQVIQGDKYRNWPIPMLDFLGYAMKPFSQSKSFGAQSAAQILRDQNNLASPDCYLNSGDMGTNWEVVSNCFSSEVLENSLSIYRNLGYKYISSDTFVEQFNINGLLTGSVENVVLLRQLGLYKDIEFIFPYSDESLVKAALTFNPLERYTYGHLSKPISRLALKSKATLSVLDQRKGQSSLMAESVFSWMRHGALRDMVRSIERPQFMSVENFENQIKEPDWLTWNMLTMDLFLKNVLLSR